MWTAAAKIFREQNVEEVMTPQKSFACRGIAVHLRSCYYDLLPIIIYFLPRPQAQRHLAKYYSTCSGLARWADSIATKAKGITSPIFFTDATDGIGLQQFKTRTYYDDANTACVSEEHATLERTPHGAGSCLREVLNKHKCVLSSVM